MSATVTTTTPATIEEQVYTETTCLILKAKGPDGAEVLGEPIKTGRSYRVRTVVLPDGKRETLSVDVQHHPKSGWLRRELPLLRHVCQLSTFAELDA